MSLKEKIAYLKGFAEGLGFNAESKEGKLFSAMIDTLSTMAEEIETLSENTLEVSEELDALSDDLADVKEFIFDGDDDDDDDDDDYIFGHFDDDDEDFDDDECDCSLCSGEDSTYEIECPSCGADIELDESDLAKGSVICEACGEELELDFEDDDEDAEDGGAEEEVLKF